MTYDVIVIGAGVIGCALARELSKYRLRTMVLEKGPEAVSGMSRLNSGLVHAGHHGSPDLLRGRLEWEGNPLWEALARELPFGYRRIGELNVAFTPEDVDTLYGLRQHGLEKGVPGMEMWDQDRLRREEPNLNPDIIAALHVPTSAVANSHEACLMLMAVAEQNGVQLCVNQRVGSIEPGPDALTVHTQDQAYAARFVINAAGIFSDEVAAMAGAERFSIRPRKGEYCILDPRVDGWVRHVIFPPPSPVSKGILVIPTAGGAILVGPTAVEADKHDLSVTRAGLIQIFNIVRRLTPGLSESDVVGRYAGLRAVSDTEDFIIGPTRVRGFLNVAGIQSPGLTAAPAIAHRVIDLLRAEGLGLVENDRFNPTLADPSPYRRDWPRENAGAPNSMTS